MNRVKCVVCRYSPLDYFYSIEKFPLLTLPTDDSKEKDILTNLDYGICPQCLCVQLTNLIDPTILYNSPNKASLTPLWKEHHQEFVRFVKSSNLNIINLCELGGANNPLYDYFDTIKHYSILDLFEPKEKYKDIQYCLGNIETFSDYTTENIILSHTFEHLYDPHAFLSKIQNSIVKNVFVSVPNMHTMLKNKRNVTIVFNEHTFYFEEKDIMNMFAEYGFHCKEFKEFKDHSLFFFFQRGALIEKNVYRKDTAKELFIKHFFERERKIKSIQLETPVYIMPSHYIGQLLYFYLEKKDNILGFIDNDKNKCNKRLYGTHCLTYEPSSSRLKDTTVLLVRNPYFTEMKEQLLSLNANIKIVEFDI